MSHHKKRQLRFDCRVRIVADVQDMKWKEHNLVFSCETELKMLTIWKSLVLTCVPNRFYCRKNKFVTPWRHFHRGTLQTVPTAQQKVWVEYKDLFRVLLSLLAGRKPVQMWEWDACRDSKTAHRIKYLQIKSVIGLLRKGENSQNFANAMARNILERMETWCWEPCSCGRVIWELL